MAVLPVADAHLAYAADVCDALRGAGLRAVVVSGQRLARRILAAHEAGIPYAAVVGGREVADRSLALRSAEGNEVLAVSDVGVLASRCAAPV